MRSRRLRRSIVAGVASLTAVLAGQSAGHAAVTARSVASHGGFNDWGCRPSAAHPEPVVLLHGLGGNGPGNFASLGPYLASQGFCAYAPTYGQTVPGVPVGGIAAIPKSATEIAAFIGRVRAATGAARTDVVGHSEGGFQALYGPKFVSGDAASIARVVALAPPTHGTTLSGLVTAGEHLGVASTVESVIGLGCPACTELTAGSDLVTNLNAGPVAQPGIAYTIIASTHDEAVTPYGTEFVSEPGVRNETVQDACPHDAVGHVGLAYDPGVAQLVRNALDPAHPVSVTCAEAPPSDTLSGILRW